MDQGATHYPEKPCAFQNLNDPACREHIAMTDRMGKVEIAVTQIQDELRTRAVSDAELRKMLEIVAKNTDELRGDLMNLVSSTLHKSQEDMANFIRQSDKSAEKEAEHQRAMEQLQLKHKQEMETQCKTEDAKSKAEWKAFIRKLLLGAAVLAATLLLSAFGISSIISPFG